MKQEKEIRSFDVEFRSEAEPKVTGYAAVFDSLSCDMWGFREKIAPGAFKKTLRESDIRALWNHDTGIVLGSVSSGNLDLREDKKGLKMDLSNPVMSEQQLEMMRRGLVNKMSFGFQTIRDQWEENRDADEVIRTLLEVRLVEVSIVTFPAYDATSASVRAVAQAEEIRSKFTAPDAHTTPDQPLIHLADHRRMTLAIAERQIKL